MILFTNRLIIVILILTLKAQIIRSVQWDTLRCSSDTDQKVPEGKVPDISRFPWLGILQHSFRLIVCSLRSVLCPTDSGNGHTLGLKIALSSSNILLACAAIAETTRFAVTIAVLIHPAYAVASAEDVAKIQPEQMTNNTKFIIWQAGGSKYALDVYDYILHPEYTDKETYATIALLQLVSWADLGYSPAVCPVLPVCLPLSGSVVLNELYAVKLTDESSELEKEIFQMKHVKDEDCKEFYYQAKLNYKMMTPKSSLCAATKNKQSSCVWDGGVALVSRKNWGFWQLIGFGLRGPGCGAPSRFLKIHDYLPWINDVINNVNMAEQTDQYKIGIRRISPIKLVMYRPDVLIPKEQGECDKDMRGGVQYKDAMEVVMTKSFGQGYYYVVISQIAQFTCGFVHMMSVTSRSNVAIWLEHNCQRDQMGIFKTPDTPPHVGYGILDPINRSQCYLYFKTAAFIEFRFFFSFKAEIECTLFGKAEIPRRIPNPIYKSESTNPWWPTDKIIHWHNFYPSYVAV